MESLMMKRTSWQSFMATTLSILAATGCGGGDTAPGGDRTAPGADRTAKTAALETGANTLQAKAPVEQIALYLVGFHPSKADPQMQMESHHYCDQVNEDFAQCALYDGNTADARLHGVEYIISEKLYATLPAHEKPYWHPHNYEILSGQLRMPGLPAAAEGEALKGKINSYGKTWHFWKTGVFGGQDDALPLGPPHLAWSFNRDGEAKPGSVEARDARMDLDTADARRRRADWSSLATPQAGVSAMAESFPAAKGAPAGVTDNGDRAARGVPTVVMKQQ
jgi:hypothetical protein